MRRACAPSGIACKIWKYDNGLRCVRTPAGLWPVDRRGRRSAGEGARPTAPRVFFTFGGPQGHVALPDGRGSVAMAARHLARCGIIVDTERGGKFTPAVCPVRHRTRTKR